VLTFEKAIVIQRLLPIKLFVARNHVWVQLPRIRNHTAVRRLLLQLVTGTRSFMKLRIILKGTTVKLKRRKWELDSSGAA